MKHRVYQAVRVVHHHHLAVTVHLHLAAAVAVHHHLVQMIVKSLFSITFLQAADRKPTEIPVRNFTDLVIFLIAST